MVGQRDPLTMASPEILVALAIFAVAFTSTLAKEWIVGDSEGWALNVSYPEWTAGKTFLVGDTLVFNYDPKNHNVITVDGTDYLSCTVPNGAVPLTTGNVTIPLTTLGDHWYICGVDDHCTIGMKLLIPVSAEAPGPSPSPSQSAATGIAFSKCHAWIFGVFSILMIMIMA